MYGSIPYMIPNIGMQTAAPAASAIAGASNLGKAAAAGTSLFSKINWSSLLSNTQKTLNVVNQAIPLYYQIKPVFNNIKTLGRIGKEFTKIGNSSTTDNITNNDINTQIKNEEINSANQETTQEVPEPMFFL